MKQGRGIGHTDGKPDPQAGRAQKAPAAPDATVIDGNAHQPSRARVFDEILLGPNLFGQSISAYPNRLERDGLVVRTRPFGFNCESIVTQDRTRS